MTVVYGSDPSSPFSLVCQIIEEQTQTGSWTVRALSDNEPSAGQVTEANYIGTVVAALRRGDGAPPTPLPRNLAQTPDAYCLLRCHVGGEIHPQALPPLAPAPGAVAMSGAQPSRRIAAWLARVGAPAAR